MSDIRTRRNAVLKSSLSLKSISNTVVNFTKGLTSARQTASDIVKKTNENNKFRRTLIGNDNNFFTKRRENARRRQREDELEASTVQGSTKRQGNIVSRSTKGFLGRILDFFGIILIGWFVNTLPKIIKSIQGLIKRIQKVIGVLSNFLETIGEILTGIGTGITDAIGKLKSGIDLLLLKRQNEEQLESADKSLNEVRSDLIKTGRNYLDTDDIDENELIVSGTEFDEKEENKDKEKEDETDKTQLDGEKKEGDESFTVDNGKPKTEKQVDNDPNDQNLIKGIKDEKDVKDLQSAESQSKGETIDDKNAVSDAEKDDRDEQAGIISATKKFIANFLGSEGQQQSTKQRKETDSKKDGTSQISSAIGNIKKIASDLQSDIKGEKKKFSLLPKRRERTNVKTKKDKNRNQVVIFEKGVPITTLPVPSGGGGGGSSLNSLNGQEGSDSLKKTMKKLQSIILA